MTKAEMTRTTTATAGGELFLLRHADVAPATSPRGASRAGHPADTVPGGVSARPQRILVAGEDVVSLAAVVDAVSAPGREVHSAACNDLALELVLQLHFDLVVLHLDRPGAGGTEVSHCIRTCHELQQPTIVIISRPADEETWTEALHCGADLVLRESPSVLGTTCALSGVLR